MTEPIQYEFYRPWPLFGKKLSNQWGESRQNSEVLAALVQAAGLDLDTTLGNSDLMSWELGQHNFHNRFRFIYDDSGTALKIQKNSGTEDVPIWVDALTIDYETLATTVTGTFSSSFYLGLNRVALYGLNQIQPTQFYNVTDLYFSSDDGFYFTVGPNGSPVVRLSDRVTGGGGGGGLSSINVRSTVSSPTYATDTIIFDKDDFYLSPSSTGKPIVSLNAEAIASLSSITITDSNNAFSDDKINFNPYTFYLTKTSDSSPQVNLENVILQDTSVPVIGPGGNTLLNLQSTADIGDGANYTGIKLTDAEEDIFWLFSSGSGGDTKNFQIYEPGTLTESGSNTNRFIVVGPGLGKAGFSGTTSPVSNQLVLLQDGKVVLGANSLDYTNYTYKLTAGGSVSATSFYVTNNQGSPIGARELRPITFKTTDLDGALVPKDYNSDALIFDRRDFYISPSSQGKPVVSLNQSQTSSGSGNTTIVSGVQSQQFPSSTEWIFPHNLNSRPLLWSTYNNNFEAFIPDKLDVSNINTAYFYFSEAVAGTAIVSSGRTSVDLTGGFYGMSIINNPRTESFKNVNLLSFDSTDFYLNQNAGNTDEVLISLKDNLSSFLRKDGGTMTGSLTMTTANSLTMQNTSQFRGGGYNTIGLATVPQYAFNTSNYLYGQYSGLAYREPFTIPFLELVAQGVICMTVLPAVLPNAPTISFNTFGTNGCGLTDARFLGLKALTTAQRDALTPSAGMVVYNTTTGVLNFYNGAVWGAV